LGWQRAPLARDHLHLLRNNFPLCTWNQVHSASAKGQVVFESTCGLKHLSHPSAWGPAHGATTQQVDMEVENALACPSSAVGYQPESAAQALHFSYLGGRQHQSAQNRSINRPSLRHAGDVLAGDDQDVGRCLGVFVPKGDDVLILVDDIGRVLAGRNPAERAVGIHGYASVTLSALGQQLEPLLLDLDLFEILVQHPS